VGLLQVRLGQRQIAWLVRAENGKVRSLAPLPITMIRRLGTAPHQAKSANIPGNSNPVDAQC